LTSLSRFLHFPLSRRAAALEDEGLYWIEEPTRADDYSGHARIRRDTKTPVQIGENWWGLHDAAKSIEAGASDYVMPDAIKIGGVTGWVRTAALAGAAGISLSSHLFPEISAHLLAVSPHEALDGVRRLGQPDP
jgi:mandelate racemase